MNKIIGLILFFGFLGNLSAQNENMKQEIGKKIEINTDTYSNGYYTIALICDGQIVDAKTLIKN